MNIILLFIEILFSSVSLVYLYKKYKYDGIYIFILLFSMILGIVSQKQVEIFDLEINSGFVINSLIFIASNILIQRKGPEENTKILSTIILSNVIVYTLSIIITICDISSINAITNNAFDELFYLNNRIYFASIISLIISIHLNSMLYHQIRQIKNKIILSNSLTTIIINFIECILFCLISYAFKIPFINIVELIVIRYIFKTTIGLIGTNIIYIVNSIER